LICLSAGSDEENEQIPPPEMIAVPPSLMLHSRHRWILPDILEYLAEDGYTGITYNDLDLAIAGEITLPEKPILITIDDLSPVRGNPSHSYFAAMKDSLVEFGFKGTFAVNTWPDDEPDEAQWEEIAGWPDDGIALETHAAHHSNLDDPNFTESDYQIEIVDSAQYIAQWTQVPVRALVTPYGSGYDHETGMINPNVVAACLQADIRFVVGIIGGRDPIPKNTAPDEVLYVGRVGPGLTDDLFGARYEIEHW
jgi:peptidoglycan/xylan/chitin deacetylase (PgdA/CDA1 family)